MLNEKGPLLQEVAFSHSLRMVYLGFLYCKQIRANHWRTDTPCVRIVVA